MKPQKKVFYTSYLAMEKSLADAKDRWPKAEHDTIEYYILKHCYDELKAENNLLSEKLKQSQNTVIETVRVRDEIKADAEKLVKVLEKK